MVDVAGYLTGKILETAGDTLLNGFLRRRADEAHEEICESLRNANLTIDQAVDQDSLIAMFYRMARAVQEGAAREKLRLLSQLLVSEIPRGKEGSDEFQQFADIIVTLNQEERVFLAVLYRIDTAARREFRQAHEAHASTANRMRQALLGPGRFFEDADDYEATGIALGRTGLLIPVSSTPTSFAKTSKLDRLIKLTQLEQFAEEALQ